MKLIKKLISLAACAGLIASMSAVSFADSTPTLNIPKGLTVTNAETLSVAGPGITFDYSIANGTASGNVRAGITGGLTIAEKPSFAVTDMLSASSSGVENTDNLVLNVDISKFSAAGIYRYLLTDTTTANTLAAAGVVRPSTYDATRYVDVYILNDTTTTPASLKVGGYVVSTDTAAGSEKAAFDGNGDLDNSGTIGGTEFDNPAKTDDIALAGDSYATYNVVLKNNVTGNMGDRQHEFPFTATIASNANRKVYVNGTLQSTASNTVSTTLSHDDTLSIKGLSNLATIAYQETNDTEDTYSVSVSGNVTVAASNVAKNGTKATTAQAVKNTASVTFNNNLEAASPTGVVMRYGAPLLVLAVAAVLILINRKAKKANAAK